MARFNLGFRKKKTENLAGGEAYAESAELELVGILLTSFAGEQFYRSADQTFDKLKELITKCDPLFVAKAAYYARTQFGMRSISHVTASELARHISHLPWAATFYDKIIYRPDDITEIIAYHKEKNGKLSNSMKRGLAKSFDKFDKYALAKYRGNNNSVKLVDAVNILHPKATEKNAEALNLLVKDELRSFNTWETELTKAGQSSENEDEKLELKKEAWATLIDEKKIGYMALLRNLRNLLIFSPESLDKALEFLVDKRAIERSLVLPFRFMTAYQEIKNLESNPSSRKVLQAISAAIDISLANAPVLSGNTLVALDVSGSMQGRPSLIGSLFAAILCKKNNADLIKFSEGAEYVSYNPADSTTTLAESIKFSAGGTNFHSIFKTSLRKYDRIIILSDMQAWIGQYAPHASFQSYKKLYNADPLIYSFDLAGYGSLQFPENKVYCLAGFSDKIFEIMKLLEEDRNALVNKIKSIEFNGK